MFVQGGFVGAHRAHDHQGVVADKSGGKILAPGVRQHGVRGLASLGAVSTHESALTLEDAVIAYLGDRSRQTSLLEKTREIGVIP